MTASSSASTCDNPMLAWYSALAGPEPVFDPQALKGLAWHGDHRVEQDEKIDSAPGADDRCGEATHRRGDEDDISTVTDCVDDSIRVLRPAGLVVLGWQPDRDRMVPTGSQLGDEPMPLPWVAPSTGNQRVRRHSSLPPALDGRRDRVDVSWRTGRNPGSNNLRCVTQNDDAGRVSVGAQQLQLRFVVLLLEERRARTEKERRDADPELVEELHEVRG